MWGGDRCPKLSTRVVVRNVYEFQIRRGNDQLNSQIEASSKLAMYLHRGGRWDCSRQGGPGQIQMQYVCSVGLN